MLTINSNFFSSLSQKGRLLKVSFLMVLFTNHFVVVNAQIYAPEGINMPGDWNGWINPPADGSAFGNEFQIPGGGIKRIVNGTTRWWKTTFTGTTGGQFLFTSGSMGNPWGNKWNETTVTMNALQNYTFNGGGANNSISCNASKFYTSIWEEKDVDNGGPNDFDGYTNTRAIFMETTNEPVLLQSISANPQGNDNLQISVTLASLPSPEELVYVCLSSDNFNSNTAILVPMNGTSGSISVPYSIATSAVLKFYGFTSTVANISGDFKLQTLNSSTVQSFNFPTIQINPSSVSSLNYFVNEGPSVSKMVNINAGFLSPASGSLLVSGSSHFEVSLNNSTFSNSITIPYSGGSVSASPLYIRLKGGLAAGNFNAETISISGGGASNSLLTASGSVLIPDPVLNLSSTQLSGFRYAVGNGPSSGQSLTINGINLVLAQGALTVTCPEHYEVSTDNVSYTGVKTLNYSNGTLSATSLFFRLKTGLSSGIYDGESATISGGGISGSILLSGNVTIPIKMSYQAIIKEGGITLNNQPVSMRISLLQGSNQGNSVYTETHQITTNSNGLVTLEIGGGTIVSGDYASIDWAKGPYFVKTETDSEGNNNYSITGISQLLTVPYALYAERAGNSGTGQRGPQGPQGPQGEKGKDGLSAFQIWLAQGNSGSEEDFLNSLKNNPSISEKAANTSAKTNSNLEKKHFIGENFGGGVIFHLWSGENGEEHGLICAEIDEGLSVDFSRSGIIENSTWNGKENSMLLIQQAKGKDNPPSICVSKKSGGFRDWYLPASDELEILFSNRAIINWALSKQNGASRISNLKYRSSTISKEGKPVILDFQSGISSMEKPEIKASVRLIRAF